MFFNTRNNPFKGRIGLVLQNSFSICARGPLFNSQGVLTRVGDSGPNKISFGGGSFKRRGGNKKTFLGPRFKPWGLWIKHRGYKIKKVWEPPFFLGGGGAFPPGEKKKIFLRGGGDNKFFLYTKKGGRDTQTGCFFVPHPPHGGAQKISGPPA